MNDNPKQTELDLQAKALGILSDQMDDKQLQKAVDHRKQVIQNLDPELLRDILIWAGERFPTPDNDPEQLARTVYALEMKHFEGLSRPCLECLAGLYEIELDTNDTDRQLAENLTPGGSFRRAMRKGKRHAMTFLAKKLFGQNTQPQDQGEQGPDKPRPLDAGQHVARKGLVKGMTSFVRGSVDDYVSEKLDEIETRIDRKLEEIDKRMDDWRQKEMSHRLKIIKITLAATVIVAVLSLLYELIKRLAG